MNRILFFLLIITFFEAEAQSSSALTVGDSLYALGDYNKAIKAYQLAENSNAKIASCYETIGLETKALTYYKKAIAQNPRAVLAQFKYAKLLFKMGHYKSADSVFVHLKNGSPKNPALPYYIGLIREKMKDTMFFHHFKRALELDDNHQNSLYKLAKYYTEKRQFETAAAYTSKGLSINSESIRFLNLEALRSFYSKDYHAALEAYKKLLTLNQSNEQLHENLGISFQKTNQFEKAIEQFTILINTFDDKRPKWHYLIGKTFMSIKEYEKAQHHIEIAIALRELPLDEEYFMLSYVFRSKKDHESQMKALEKAILENPDNQQANYFLATAADNYFKDREVVIEYYERYLKRFGDQGNYSEYAKIRIKDIKEAMHFNKD